MILEKFYEEVVAGQTGYLTTLLDRQPVLDFLQKKRSQGKFTVVDVGSAAAAWTKDVVDATVDIKPLPESKLHFKLDLHEPDTWDHVLEHVEKNGKFDFSICCHTIEDLHYPKTALKFLRKISHQGFISVPSTHRELKHVGHYSKGYDHHFWMFKMGEGMELIMIPKMNHIEHTNYPISNDPAKEELHLLWKNEITVKHFWSFPHTQIAELYQNTSLIP